MIKTVHVGGISHNDRTIHTINKSTKRKLLQSINDWLFDYSRSTSISTIYQLPPLDDWSHSNEDSTFWYINYPTGEWLIWIKSELMEFD